MSKLMYKVKFIDTERMEKDPPIGYAMPHKINLEDLFLCEQKEFEAACNKQELFYSGQDILDCHDRDEKYLTDKIKILKEFTKRCEIIRDVLSEDLDLWEVAQRLNNISQKPPG